VFAALLRHDDAYRASEVVKALLAHGLRCALAGGLAIKAQLRLHGRLVLQRHLNDIDFVVEGFASIPESLAASFLQHVRWCPANAAASTGLSGLRRRPESSKSSATVRRKSSADATPFAVTDVPRGKSVRRTAVSEDESDETAYRL
jgi:hypothetical protein